MLIGRTEAAEPLAKRFGSRKIGEAGFAVIGVRVYRDGESSAAGCVSVGPEPGATATGQALDSRDFGEGYLRGSEARGQDEAASEQGHHGSAKRNLLVAGHAKQPVALLKARTKTLEEQIPGWKK